MKHARTNALGSENIFGLLARVTIGHDQTIILSLVACGTGLAATLHVWYTSRLLCQSRDVLLETCCLLKQLTQTERIEYALWPTKALPGQNSSKSD